MPSALTRHGFSQCTGLVSAVPRLVQGVRMGKKNSRDWGKMQGGAGRKTREKTRVATSFALELGAFFFFLFNSCQEVPRLLRSLNSCALPPPLFCPLIKMDFEHTYAGREIGAGRY